MGLLEKMRLRGVTPKAVAYARFSSDNQREESIDAQLRAIRDYAKKNGIILIGKYIDKARSATTDDRPQFLQMIEDSKQESFNIVLVHKLDRFARNRQDSIGYRMELKKNGVSLVSVLEYLDEESPESIILESVLEAMAEYYSKNLAREVKKGMKENALQCISTGGRPPFGYSIDSETRKYVINEYEKPAVQMIFNGICEGKGYNQIINELNKEGYRTRNNKPFGKNSIHEILRNEKYRGVYIFNRASAKDYRGKRNNHLNKYDDEVIRIEGGIPAIIDDETFEAVTRIITSRKKLSPSKAAKENYLLAGKIFCGECGNSMSGNRKFSGRNKRLHVTYRCNTRTSKTSTECSNKELRREYIESFVMKELSKIIFDEKHIPSLVKGFTEYNKATQNNAGIKVKKLTKQLKETEEKINNIVSAIASSGSTALLSALETLEQEKAQLETMLAEEEAYQLQSNDITEAQIYEAYAKARELFLTDELEEKRQLINLYLNKVVVYREHVEIFLNMLPIFLLAKNNPTQALNNTCVGKCGGGEGSRTPVRKRTHENFSECSLCFNLAPAASTNTLRKCQP